MRVRCKAYNLAIIVCLLGYLSANTGGQTAQRELRQADMRAPGVSPSSSEKSDPSYRYAADDSDFAKDLGAYLEQASTRDAFSGAVLVGRNSQLVFAKAYGLSNKATSAANSTDTKFNIGSLSKMFTAVAIAQLAERGKLSFDDTVGKLLPDYPNKEVAQKVTVHQLLTHTSGMGDYQNETYRANLKKMKTVSDLLPLFVEDSLKFEPGLKWEYSNAGFALLGLIVEKLTGQDYFVYVREQIFKRAGMLNTDSYEISSNVAKLAIGYARMDDEGRADPAIPRRENTHTRPARGSPAGGGYSTVEDLFKFSVALLGHKLLSKKYTETLMTGKVEVGGPVGKYAYGFSDKVFNGRHIVGHNGGAPGIGANLDIYPEVGYAAVVLTNYGPPAMMPVIMKIRELVPTSSGSTRGPN